MSTAHWRVAHAFNSTLPGWLVILPTRHLLALTEILPEAAGELGGLLHRLSRALEQVTGCTKTYLMQFSEAEGFSHLHVHVVPRMPDQPDDRCGPAVFGYLVDDEQQYLPAAERDRVACGVRTAMEQLAQ
ncbi:HIT family protein [Nocardioides acrostichi]|uniref:HIT family protein n=1 Tax=Nocardioides acrostichi TaxID=2784339 RepID=UPI001A9C93A1|nr:HIT domain-containing protein [Nocardioides acrostichi]